VFKVEQMKTMSSSSERKWRFRNMLLFGLDRDSLYFCDIWIVCWVGGFLDVKPFLVLFLFYTCSF